MKKKTTSKINPNDLAKNFLWEQYVSHPNEGSGYYIILDGAGKGKVYRGLWASSTIHPSHYAELTWAEFYEWNELYSDQCCATCDRWQKTPGEGPKPYSGTCCDEHTAKIFHEGAKCEKYNRRLEYLGKRELMSEYDRFIAKKKNLVEDDDKTSWKDILKAVVFTLLIMALAVVITMTPRKKIPATAPGEIIDSVEQTVPDTMKNATP